MNFRYITVFKFIFTSKVIPDKYSDFQIFLEEIQKAVCRMCHNMS